MPVAGEAWLTVVGVLTAGEAWLTAGVVAVAVIGDGCETGVGVLVAVAVAVAVGVGVPTIGDAWETGGITITGGGAPPPVGGGGGVVVRVLVTAWLQAVALPQSWLTV